MRKLVAICLDLFAGPDLTQRSSEASKSGIELSPKVEVCRFRSLSRIKFILLLLLSVEGAEGFEQIAAGILASQADPKQDIL